MAVHVEFDGITINTATAPAMGGGIAEGTATVHLVLKFDRQQVKLDIQMMFSTLDGLMDSVRAQLADYGRELVEVAPEVRA